MKKLFVRMQEYQYERIKNNPDTVLSDEIRVLQDEDIQRYVCMYVHTHLPSNYDNSREGLHHKEGTHITAYLRCTPCSLLRHILYCILYT